MMLMFFFPPLTALRARTFFLSLRNLTTMMTTMITTATATMISVMYVFWFMSAGEGMGMLISMIACPLILCCLAFSSFRMYRGASVVDLSDGEVRAVCMKELPGNVYAAEVDEGEY